MYLVMLETNGNQRYIFSSPRLRESIGASFQLTRLASWTKEALGEPSVCHPTDPWVSRSSGKVIIMVDGESDAVSLIGRVTRRALAEAPGMDVSGVYVDMGGKKYVDAAALKEVHIKAAEYALSRPPALARFSQMPFLTRAKDSVLPAAPPLGIRDEATDDTRTALSLPSRVKRHLALASRESLLDRARIEGGLPDEELARDPLKLERMLQPLGDDDSLALSKIAVIHIDGNGVGAIMRDLDMAMKKVPDGDFRKEVRCGPDDPDALRRFLLKVNERLENSVIQAFVTAWRDVANWACRRTGREHTAIPVVPVILGGDDVTVITSGDYALPFAASFLAHFEKQTEEDGLLKYLHGVDKVATGELQPEDVIPAPMTAAAGVAIVRRNFPFHIAYELAEKLVGRAKGVGKNENPPCSTLDFHVLFDTTVIDPDGQLGGYKDLSTRPFCFVERAPDAASESFPQAPATWEDTCRRVARFRGFRDPDDTDDRTEPFPRTRAARIRKLLSDGKRDEAMKHWNAAKDKTGTDLDKELGDLTALFDLLELADLLPDSYLQETTGLTPPEASTNPTSTPAEALS